MVARILHDDRDREAWVRFLTAQPLPMTVSHIKGKRRSIVQNALQHMHYGEIAAATGQSTAEAKAECKLRYGVPIMERDRPDWTAKWKPLYGTLPYDMRLRLFEAIPLTSLFTTRQGAEYNDAIFRDYRAQGISLTDPDARKYAGEMGNG